MAVARILHKGAFVRTRHAAYDSGAQGDALASRMGSRASLGPDFDFLGDVVENADADVVELESFLDLGHDVGQHLLGIFARDGRFRNAVEEAELPGTAQFLGEQARVFHRDRELAGSGLHDFEIALLENIFLLGVHGHDGTGGLVRPA